MTREQLTEAIRAAKLRQGLTWKEIADKVGRSPVWTTAALLGQLAMNEEEAGAAAAALGLDAEAETLLQTVPYRGSLRETVPIDPLLYRFYELLQVYGTTIKELVQEEFGDGIMSAIDFQMAIEREPDPKGDRVRVVFSGKFLPYKKY